jgi:adenosine kinase
MQGAYALVVNAYEAEVICHKTGQNLVDLRNSVEILVVTQGERGSHVYTDGDRIDVPAFPSDEIKDPTGAGDSYRAGLIRGIVGGWPLELAGQVGALCATYTLEQTGTQNHRFTIPEFVARFRTRFDDAGLLDTLMQPHPPKVAVSQT